MNLRPDSRFQVMQHQIKHRDDKGLYKIQKISEFANRDRMEWKELKKFILNFIKNLDYKVDLDEYFYTKDVRKLRREGFVSYELIRKERSYFLTEKGENELRNFMDEK